MGAVIELHGKAVDKMIFHKVAYVDCNDCQGGKVKHQIDVSGDYEEEDCLQCSGTGYALRARCGAIGDLDDDKANCEKCK